MQSDRAQHGVVPSPLPPGRRRLAAAKDVGLEFSSLEIRTRQLSNRTYVVAPQGTLDVCTTARLEHALSRLVEARASLVVVDLTEAMLADSAPLGLLVLVEVRLSHRGGVLVLARADNKVRDLLQATGLNAVFHVEHSLPPSTAVRAARAASRGKRPRASPDRSFGEEAGTGAHGGSALIDEIAY